MRNLSKMWVVLGGFFVVLVVVGLVFSYMKNSSAPASMTSVPGAGGWSTYENTKFGYKLRYPKGGNLKYGERDAVLLSDASDLSVYRYAENGMMEWGSVQIRAVIPSQLEFAPDNRLAEKEKQIAYSDAKSFAIYGLQAEIDYLKNNQTPYNSKLHPSGLLTATIGGRNAYGFRINGFSEAWPLGGFERPVLSATNNYFVFADDAGNKFIIAYPADDPISQQIVDSFRFTNATTSAVHGR